MNEALNHYERELVKLRGTYERSLQADVSRLKAAIAAASEASVIGIGSGGSFTVASLLCNLHEAYTGRVSRPSTPLEITCNPTLAATCPVFLVSAEGKNPDIVEAMKRSRQYSARALHVLTNRERSPLLTSAGDFSDINTHVFPLEEKDGYLATNSLLMNCVLVARAYSELDKNRTSLPSSIDSLNLKDDAIPQWLDNLGGFVEESCRRRSIIIIYSPYLRPVALDLESKLSEAALLHAQITDLRSFAHGRHLWLAERPADSSVIALIEPSLHKLWSDMRALLPTAVPAVSLSTANATPADLIAGLVAQMHLVARIARCLGKDPGKPDVPQFGRDLHYANLSRLVPNPPDPIDRGEHSKYHVLGAGWPYLEKRGTMRRAAEAYIAELEQRRFRSIVFDYDGTLCTSRRDEPPPEQITGYLTRFADHGITIAIASGRGASVQEQLQKTLPQRLWKKILLGLYNCGHIADLSAPVEKPSDTSELLSHANRIITRLKTVGVPINRVRATHPYQLSVRFEDGVATEQMWFVVGDALRQAGLDLHLLVRSSHSVDVLAPGLSKSLLLAHVIQGCKLDPYQIMTVGDQGAWPGNDYDLLEHRFSLSVDSPSRRLDRGWKFAPPHRRNVDATVWYLERIRLLEEGEFQIALSAGRVA